MLQKPHDIKAFTPPPPAGLGVFREKDPGTLRPISLEQFTALYETYAPRIRNYIHYRLADEKQAEDITSQVFLKAWEKRTDYTHTGAPPLSWLYAIARNAVIDDHRTYKEVEPIESADLPVNHEMDPASVCENDHEVELLQKALKRLTPDQQQVVVWKFIDEMSTEEIADRMGKQTGSVRALQMRALKSLSRYLEEIEQAENLSQ